MKTDHREQRFRIEESMKGYRATILLSTLVAVLSSCVVTYTDFPSIDLHTDPIPRGNATIYYNIDPLAYLEQAMRHSGISRFPLMTSPSRQHYAELERVFAESKLSQKRFRVLSPPTEVSIAM
jgi:hypothetical protein